MNQDPHIVPGNCHSIQQGSAPSHACATRRSRKRYCGFLVTSYFSPRVFITFRGEAVDQGLTSLARFGVATSGRKGESVSGEKPGPTLPARLSQTCNGSRVRCLGTHREARRNINSPGCRVLHSVSRREEPCQHVARSEGRGLEDCRV